MLLEHEKTVAAVERLAELTTDVRLLYRPLVSPLQLAASGTTPVRGQLA